MKNPFSTFFTHACVALCYGLLPQSATAAEPQTSSKTPDPFAQGNLHAWAYEEYDSVQRTPDERAQVLQQLGISRAGYIARDPARVAEFEAYVIAYQKYGIQLVAAWTPLHTDKPLDEPHVRTFLDVVRRHNLKLQWWFTLEHMEEHQEGERIERAAAQIRQLIPAAKSISCDLVLYGHGRDHWFTQIENQIAVIERVKRDAPSARLGIVYNFHQSHAQMDRLKDVFPRLKPYLSAVNLDGMRAEGPQIITLGQGDREAGMIKIIRESGWTGCVGIISHNRKVDARVSLQQNLEGLRAVLEQIQGEVRPAR